MLVLDVQNSDSVIYIYKNIYIYIYIYILFQPPFPYRLLQSIEYNFLVLHSKSLLATYLIYNSVYMLNVSLLNMN